MRKPNYGEAALDFAQLKAQMRRDKFPQYAAFCALAVARCEQALGRTNQEVAQYTEAGWWTAHVSCIMLAQSSSACMATRSFWSPISAAVCAGRGRTADVCLCRRRQHHRL